MFGYRGIVGISSLAENENAIVPSIFPIKFNCIDIYFFIVVIYSKDVECVNHIVN